MKLWLYVLCMVLASWSAKSQTASPILRISTPVDGTMIQPGQTVSVEVKGLNLPPTGKELVSADIPIAPSSSQQAGGDITFTLSIPKDIEPGFYGIWAVDLTPAGIFQSPGIILKVAPTFKFDSLTFDIENLALSSPGDQSTLSVAGVTDGVSRLVDTQFLTVMSLDTSVATVDAYGVVTAVSKGKTQILASYGNVTGVVNVSVGDSAARPTTTTNH